jgi:hypothetical protein
MTAFILVRTVGGCRLTIFDKGAVEVLDAPHNR